MRDLRARVVVEVQLDDVALFVRIAELGTMYRYEKSGVVGGRSSGGRWGANARYASGLACSGGRPVKNTATGSKIKQNRRCASKYVATEEK